MQTWLWATVLALSLAGCSESKNKVQPETTKVIPEKPDKPETTAPSKPRPPNIADNEVQAVVDTWLRAQNEGDFAAYESVYAAKFTGTKRVGTSKTYRFARKGWLADRKRMFKRKMVVSADAVSILAAPKMAEVRFVQSWASGRFEDRGPKRLLIVLEGDTLKIAQEEMLKSELLRSKDQTLVTDLYFLLGDGMVLHDAAVPEAHGKPELVADHLTAARASVGSRALGEAAAWKGKKVRTDAGCEATVDGFYLLSRVEPHFGTVQGWECSEHMFEEDEDCQPYTDAEIAEEVFSSENAVVIAKLDGCTDGHYARSAEAPMALEAETVEDVKIKAMAIAAFAKLEAVTEQDDEREEGGKDWWKGAEEVLVVKHPKSGQVLVSVSADNEGMCGEYSASYWQIWEYKKGRLLEYSSGTPPLSILAGIDADGDGDLELLVKGNNFGSEQVLLDAKTLDVLVELSYSYNDCPC